MAVCLLSCDTSSRASKLTKNITFLFIFLILLEVGSLLSGTVCQVKESIEARLLPILQYRRCISANQNIKASQKAHVIGRVYTFSVGKQVFSYH